jgi:branched-chain amino acid transport system permease protein
MGWKNRLALIGFIIVFSSLPGLIGDPYTLGVLVYVGIYCLITIGLSLLMGYAGQISLGHAAFYGIGAYSTAILTTKAGLNPWLALGAGMVLAGMLAFLIGMPALKLKGHYLAMATLAFGVIVYVVFEAADGLTGGASGIGGVPRLEIWGTMIRSETQFFFLVWGSVALALGLALNLIRSRVGRALRSIHSSETAAEAMGVPVAWYKVQIFVLSAALGALAGSYYAHFTTFVGPTDFGFRFSVTLVTMVAVGGMSSLWGALAGTILLGLLPEFLKGFEDNHLLIYGGILIVIMLFVPEGLVVGAGRLLGWSYYRLKPDRKKVAPES